MKVFNRHNHPSKALIEITGLTFIFGSLAFGYYVLDNAVIGMLVGVAGFLVLIVAMARWGERNRKRTGSLREEHED